jgi:glutamate racemase
MTLTIAVIDSGMGGEYFEQQLKLVIPHARTIRYKETSFKSYANISIEELCEVSLRHIDYIYDNLDADNNLDCIVVACMTLSSNCLFFIKNQVNVPVYDMLTCLPYITNDTLVFATPNTIKSNRFSYCVEVPCNKLSLDIEQKATSAYINYSLRQYTSRLNIEHTKKILLGCSHYSIIKQQFQEVFEPDVIIDPIKILVSQISKIYD